MHHRRDAVFFAGVDDVLEDFEVLGIVHFVWDAERSSEIVRSHEDSIDLGTLQKFVQSVDARFRFDTHDEDVVLMPVVQVLTRLFAGQLTCQTSAFEILSLERMQPHLVGACPNLFDGLAVGHEDAVSSSV